MRGAFGRTNRTIMSPQLPAPYPFVPPGAKFIAPDGDGGTDGSGTVASPYKLWETAFAALGPGDTLVCESGTYTIAANGSPHVTSEHTNGTSASPITVMSRHERLARVQTDGYLGVSIERDYWDVWGLTVEASDRADLGAFTAMPQTVNAGKGTTGVRLRRLLVFRNNRYHNCQGITLLGMNGLAEECEVYATHRHGIMNFSSRGNIVRRCYVNPRTVSDIAGGYESGNATGGDEGVSAYGASDCLFENCITHGRGYGFQIHGGPIYAENGGGAGGVGNRVLGCIAYDTVTGLHTSTRVVDEVVYRPIGNRFKDCVVSNAYLYGISEHSGNDAEYDRCVLAAGQDTLGGSWLRVLWSESESVPASAVSTQIRNSVIWGNSHADPVFGPSAVDFAQVYEKFTVEHSVLYDNDGNTSTSYGNGSASELITDEEGSYQRNAATNPAGGTYGIGTGKSLVWVPADHPFVGAGRLGAVIGADVRFATVDGQATSIPLWTRRDGSAGFPCGAVVNFGTDADGFVLSNDPSVTPGDCLADFHALPGINMGDSAVRAAAYGT